MEPVTQENITNIPDIQPQSSMPSQPVKPGFNKRIVIVVLSVIIVSVMVAGIIGYVFKDSLLSKSRQESVNKSSIVQMSPSPIRETFITSGQVNTEDYIVEIKENPQDELKSDIFLKNIKTSQEEFFMTLTDLYRNHYHKAEYHNGNIYLIKRTGGDMGYIKNPDWIDELWRYDSQKEGVKIFAIRGLDFRVSDDEKGIIIRTNSNLYLLNGKGKTIKTFNVEDLKPDENSDIGFHVWTSDTIWLDGAFGPSLAGITSIDTRTFKVTKYNLSDLPAGPEYTFNPEKKLMAYTNYPAIFDTEGAEEQRGKEVVLWIYNIETKQTEVIAHTITIKLSPKWIDSETLEYNNPDGQGRLTKKF